MFIVCHLQKKNKNNNHLQTRHNIHNTERRCHLELIKQTYSKYHFSGCDVVMTCITVGNTLRVSLAHNCCRVSGYIFNGALHRLFNYMNHKI